MADTTSTEVGKVMLDVVTVLPPEPPPEPPPELSLDDAVDEPPPQAAKETTATPAAVTQTPLNQFTNDVRIRPPETEKMGHSFGTFGRVGVRLSRFCPKRTAVRDLLAKVKSIAKMTAILTTVVSRRMASR